VASLGENLRCPLESVSIFLNKVLIIVRLPLKLHVVPIAVKAQARPAIAAALQILFVLEGKVEATAQLAGKQVVAENRNVAVSLPAYISPLAMAADRASALRRDVRVRDRVIFYAIVRVIPHRLVVVGALELNLRVFAQDGPKFPDKPEAATGLYVDAEGRVAAL